MQNGGLVETENGAKESKKKDRMYGLVFSSHFEKPKQITVLTGSISADKE
jgi:hypothetical protein